MIEIEWPIIGPALLATLSFFLIVPLMRRVAKKMGFVDRPGGRKTHVGLVPLIGGIAMFVAFLIGAAFISGWHLDLKVFTLGALALIILGVIDDALGVSAIKRLIFQAIIAFLICSVLTLQVNSLGNLFGLGDVNLGWLAIPFTVLAMVGMINAMNMLDGADGLAGGVALIATSFFLLLAYLGGAVNHFTWLLLVCGVIFGFLYFNLQHRWRDEKSRMFMGDSGSCMLGFMVAWFAIDLSQSSPPLTAPITVLWILALPTLDSLAVIYRRLIQGKNPMRADRQHLHHMMLMMGMSQRSVVFRLHLLAFLLGSFGIGGWIVGVPDAIMFALFVIFAGFYIISLPLILEKKIHHQGKGTTPSAPPKPMAKYPPPLSDSEENLSLPK